LSSGINGDIFKYQWHRGRDNTTVAVKKLRNATLKDFENAATDERCVHLTPRLRYQSNEDALTEIGVLSYLSKQPDLPLYLLKMLGVYSEKQFTWLVTEFADGGELFDVAVAGGLTQTKIQEYTWQLLQAVDYLHRHSIGHRDISLENVLLKDDTVRLMDYGMAVCSHSSLGAPLRYFREVGKPFYRAPECYVPTRDEVVVTPPLSSGPGDVVMAHVAPNFLCEVRLPRDMVHGTSCSADVWGYAVVPADMFALGICMFILAFQCPAWECAKLSNRFFAHAYNSDNGIESLLKLWGKQHILCPEAMRMLSSMLQADPAKRPSAASCLNHAWFDELSGKHEQLCNSVPSR
jgi:serine/threonine protein kinase